MGKGLVNSAIAASVETQASDPLTIHDLHIIGFGVSGIETTTNGQQSTDIQGVHITLTVTSTGNGITLAGSNCIVKNSTIDYAGNNGIYGAGKNIAFENALIEGNTVSNIQLNDGITLHGGPFDGDHNVIRSNEIFDIIVEDGIDIVEGHNYTTIEDNEIYRCAVYGIIDKGSSTTIQRNFVYDCDACAISAKGLVETTICCNLTMNSGLGQTRSVVELGDIGAYSVNSLLANNTIIGESNIFTNGIVQIFLDATSPAMKNNIIVTENVVPSIYDQNSLSDVDYNLTVSTNGTPYNLANVLVSLVDWRISGRDANGLVTTDPKFINAVAGDYNLQETSPAVGIGVKWWGNKPRPTSMNGEPLPDTGIDMGAYQSTWDANHPANL